MPISRYAGNASAANPPYTSDKPVLITLGAAPIIPGPATIDGNLTVDGNLVVTGNTTLQAATVDGNLVVNGNTTLQAAAALTLTTTSRAVFGSASADTESIVRVTGAMTGMGITGNTQYGVNVTPTYNNTDTSEQYGLVITPTGAAAGAAYNTNYTGLRINDYTLGTNQVVNAKAGLYIQMATGGATQLNGIVVNVPLNGTQNNQIYCSGSAPCVFLGRLSVGTQSADNVLTVLATASTVLGSAATQRAAYFGLTSNGTVPATAIAGIEIAGSSTGSGTTANVYRINMAAYSKGAGHTITTYTGINIPAQPTSGTAYAIRATHAYGASNQWNLFIDGTAASYIAGGQTAGASLTIGSTVANIGSVAGNTVRGLAVTGANTAFGTVLVSRFSTDVSPPLFLFNKSRNTTPGSKTIVASGDGLGSIIFAADDGVDYDSIAARIDAFVDGTPGSNDMPGRLDFSTTADAAAAPTLRLRLDQAGNVVCGNAALATNATNGFFYVAACAGTPTGAPTAVTGRVPIVVDSTNNKLYFYTNGAWRDAGP